MTAAAMTPATSPDTTPRTVVSRFSAVMSRAKDPRTLPSVDGGSHWLFAGWDHDQLHDERDRLLAGDPQATFVSFGSVHAGDDRPHTAQLLAFSDHTPFERWAGQRWRRRGRDYDRLKTRMGDGLVRFADQHLPGLADLVDYVEVATPVTVTSMTGHPGGAVYGTPVAPRSLLHGRPGPTTPVPGLTLAGADVAFLGVAGSMMGGVLAAASILGSTGFPRVIRAAAHAPQDVTRTQQTDTRSPALTP